VRAIEEVEEREESEGRGDGGKGKDKDKDVVVAEKSPSIEQSDAATSPATESQALVTTDHVATATSTTSNASTTTALIRHAPPTATLDPSLTQLVIPNSLPTASPTRTPSPTSDLREVPLAPASHLYRALYEAGLPETAIVTRDGEVVPVREVASGTGGQVVMRGREVAERREVLEKQVMEEEKDEREKVVPGWGYRVSFLVAVRGRRGRWGLEAEPKYRTNAGQARNSLYFGPDADVSPLVPVSIAPPSNANELRQAPREIKHANTRLPDEEEEEDVARRRVGSSRRGTSPSRSAVGAAISGTPCECVAERGERQR
jgi:protein DGCR14